jgi:hypothetical protein
MVEHLPNKQEHLSSNSSISKKNLKRQTEKKGIMVLFSKTISTDVLSKLYSTLKIALFIIKTFTFFNYKWKFSKYKTYLELFFWCISEQKQQNNKPNF